MTKTDDVAGLVERLLHVQNYGYIPFSVRCDVTAAADALQSQAAEIARLREAVERAKAQFLFYAEQHLAKPPTDDTLAKARVNTDLAREMAAALAQQGGDDGQN